MDNIFAENFFKRMAQSHTLPLYPSASKLCKQCRSIDLRRTVSLSSLKGTAESCDLCIMLCQNLEVRGEDEQSEIRPLKSQAILGICTTPGL